MTTERIKEIQQQTASPDSVSVYLALLKVWNECEQENSLLKDFIDWHNKEYPDNYIPNSRIGMYNLNYGK